MLVAARLELKAYVRAADRNIAPGAVVINRAHIRTGLADLFKQQAELARTIVQRQRNPVQTTHLRQAVADDSIEQIDINISAAHHDDDPFARELRAQFQGAGQSGRAGTFGQQLHPLEHQQHRGADLEIIDGHGAAHASANQAERNLADSSGGEAVGDRIDRFSDRRGVIGGKARAELRGACGLDADNFGPAGASLECERDSRDQSSAADRNEDRIGSARAAKLVSDLQADSALPRDDMRIIIRVDEYRARFTADSAGGNARGLVVDTFEDNRLTVVARRRDFRDRRRLRASRSSP